MKWTENPRARLALAGALVFVAGLGLGLLLSGDGEKPAPAATGAKAKWYTCSMHPQIRLPDPDARCPICGMELIPVVEDAGADEAPRRLVMSEAAKALAEVETVPAERRFVTKEMRLVGKVDYDETRLKSITAWVPGRLERLYVDYTGVAVTKGAKLVEIYSPELLVAQQGLLEADRALAEMKKARASASNLELQQGTVGALEERLRLWGLTDAQIAEIRARGTASDRMTILSPISGIVIHRMAVEGDYVNVGSKIYGIADLSRVWIYLDAYESDMAWIRYAQEAELEAEAYPGEVFRGRVSFVDPFLNERTRTVRLRVTADNEHGRLKPGMFVRAKILAKLAEGGRVVEPFLDGKWLSPVHPEIVRDAPGDCPVCGTPLVPAETLGYAGRDAAAPLVIPDTAPLRTGQRAVVYVEVPGAPSPTYEGRVVRLGPRARDTYVVEEGLEEGERVVVKGNFKIDSALQIRARESMMSPPAKGEEEPVAAPPEFVRSLTPLYRASLAAQQALAADDLAAARAALAEAARAATGTGDPGPARDAWNELGMRLVRHARAAAGVAELGAARKAFEPFSKDLLLLVRRFGHATGAKLVEAFCPMAFDDRGASWLQEGEAIRNPYFGSGMLECGEVRAAFPSAAVPSPAAREAVAAALPPYLEAHAALAADDLAGARKAAGALAAEAAELSALREAMGSLRDAADLEAARRAFALASDALLGLLRAHGAPEGLAWFHCPMAFGGRGAEWIQRGKEVSNPYFGKAMPRCGEPRGQPGR